MNSVNLIIQAGLMAKFVLLILFVASLFSWAVIFMKWRKFKKAEFENKKFLNLFWNSKSVDEIFSKCDSGKMKNSNVAAVFQAGFKEYKKNPAFDSKSADISEVENIGRALMRASQAEVSHLEKYIGWLATTASAAPFVGLFGTVWGIMNSFQNIGLTGAANLAVVAPGISEALITTATGIGAAIPAVVGYNYFVGRIKKLTVDMDCFIQDFLNIIHRNILNNRKGA